MPIKAIIFTENRQSQEYISRLIKQHTSFKSILFDGDESMIAFTKRAQILIATDVAAESFNFQHCPLVINFDMPWSVQKIEQSIGRCHRIGQKNDVSVLNFLCPENYADVRFYELVYKRTAMNDGVLCSSDGVVLDATGENVMTAMAHSLAAVRSSAAVNEDLLC